jgi:hypothetical protein
MLTSLVTVTDRIGLESSGDDALLGRLIASASRAIESSCFRSFDRVVGDTFTTGAEHQEINLPRYPVESVSKIELKESGDGAWLTITPGYSLIGNILAFDSIQGTWAQLVRVTYTGGYVTPGEPLAPGQQPVPSDLENACVEQVVYWYQNRNRFKAGMVSGQGTPSVQQPGQSLLPGVLEAIAPYRRLLA